MIHFITLFRQYKNFSVEKPDELPSGDKKRPHYILILITSTQQS